MNNHLPQNCLTENKTIEEKETKNNFFFNKEDEGHYFGNI